MKKKIAFLLQNLEGGGAERVVLNILNSINLDIFDVSLILIENRGVYLEQLKNRSGLDVVTFSNICKSRHINFIVNYLRALIFLKRQGYSVIFSQYNPGKLLGFFKFLYKGQNLIYRETNIPQAENKSRKFYLQILNKIFYKYGINNYEQIIVQSEDMKVSLLRIAGQIKKKISLINNPIDCNFIEKQLSELNGSKNIFTLPNAIRLISIGRLSYQKGYDLLIKTVSDLKDKTVELVILGEGIDKNKLEKLIDNYKLGNKVKLIGFKKNPYKYIAQADYFISSSRFEGFPNAVLEACACGVPVIANNYTGGIKEIINSDVNGVIINIESVKEFSESLSKVYNSETIKKDIKNRFSVEKIVAEYENLFLKVLRGA